MVKIIGWVGVILLVISNISFYTSIILFGVELEIANFFVSFILSYFTFMIGLIMFLYVMGKYKKL